MGCTKHIVFHAAAPLTVFHAAVTLTACYAPPAADERFNDTVVVTSRDEGVDFATFQTFFVRPEIRVLDESVASDARVAGAATLPAEMLPAATSERLLEATRQNLVARGYTEAAVKAEADLAVEMVYLRTIYTDYYCYSWSDWYYWGYPGYSYYYPYSCDTAAWRSGMVVTNAVNLVAAGPAREAEPMGDSVLRGVWFSGIYGAEVDTSVQSALDGINQAFTQSPYFAATP
jgi:uncharacterized protein DUF4136